MPVTSPQAGHNAAIARARHTGTRAFEENDSRFLELQFRGVIQSHTHTMCVNSSLNYSIPSHTIDAIGMRANSAFIVLGEVEGLERGSRLLKVDSRVLEEIVSRVDEIPAFIRHVPSCSLLCRASQDKPLWWELLLGASAAQVDSLSSTKWCSGVWVQMSESLSL